ncbi:hypothetical protein ARALYDRAFT_910253 [Arabidopsis lyrata subsp. lyrata]|uniref:F-box/LRR-repeat protein 15/At3g58940/PEG3-like LRR domain-containing protein n=1 Tax=Arabidopsis lyrata subsp. lyrata TaxID=81972 RepID=D7M1H0_ARALL|nr:hypothetical protein ARALYDRAFT_910253 [Arabidopsis lyrata subsp. lyrata]
MGNFESVSLPRLKTLCLERNIYPNEASVESLISSCPVLEDLTIVRMNDNVKVLRVYSQSLTSFSVGYNPGDLIRKYNYYSEKVRENSGLVIDAPRLKYLTFNYERSKSKIVRNLSSLVKVNVLSAFDISSVVGCSEQQMAHNFFTGISRVREMIISQNMMEKLVLHLQYSFLKQGNPAILKDLIALPRRSSMCQIEVFNVHNGRALGIF